MKTQEQGLSLFQDPPFKTNLSGSVTFHQDMLGLPNFGLDLGICIANEVSFIKAYLINSFYDVLKDPTIIPVIILHNSQIHVQYVMCDV